MEPFLRAYFDTFKYKSIDSDVFRKYFEQYFTDELTGKMVDWNAWLYTPGMPPVIPNYDRSLAVICEELVERFLTWNGTEPFPITSDETDKLTTSQVQ